MNKVLFAAKNCKKIWGGAKLHWFCEYIFTVQTACSKNGVGLKSCSVMECTSTRLVNQVPEEGAV